MSKRPIVTISILSLNLLYSHTNFKMNNLLDSVSQFHSKLNFLKPNDVKSENYFVKCFNCLFSSVTVNEQVLSLIFNLIIGYKMERICGSMKLLQGVGLAYVGTTLSMLPSTSKYYPQVEGPYNSQIFNIPLLSLCTLFFAGKLGLILNTCVFGLFAYNIFLVQDPIPYDLRTGLFFSLILSMFIKRPTQSREIKFITDRLQTSRI